MPRNLPETKLTTLLESIRSADAEADRLDVETSRRRHTPDGNDLLMDYLDAESDLYDSVVELLRALAHVIVPAGRRLVLGYVEVEGERVWLTESVIRIDTETKPHGYLRPCLRLDAAVTPARVVQCPAPLRDRLMELTAPYRTPKRDATRLVLALVDLSPEAPIRAIY